MGETLGGVLGPAMGIALSPVPLVVMVVTLMGAGGHGKGLALLGGWLLGLVVALAVFTAVGPVVGGDDPGQVSSVLRMTVGGLFLLLALRSWRSRPTGDEAPELPGLLNRMQAASTVGCLGLGVLLVAVNLKNLGLAAAAGGSIGAAELTFGQSVVVGLVVTVIGSIGMLTAVGATVLAPDRSAPGLEHVQTWLIAHNSTVVFVVLLLMGTNLIGDGIRGLA